MPTISTWFDTSLKCFLKSNPQVINSGVEGERKVVFLIRTMHRDLDGFCGTAFQDLMVYYDGIELWIKW